MQALESHGANCLTPGINLTNDFGDLINAMKQDTVLNGALIVISVCTLVVTAGAVHRIVGDRSVRKDAPSITVVKDWRSYQTDGDLIGSADAPVQIVEFADFQCPFCGREASAIDSVLALHHGDVTLRFRHFPLDAIHPYAHAAALAGICADRLGWFPAFYRTVFDNQDSLPRRSWSWFARKAGQQNATRLESCMKDPATTSALERELAAGKAADVSATPTMLVNEFRIVGAIPITTLDSVVNLASHDR